MAISITTRTSKGSPLNATEHDTNLENIVAAIENTSTWHDHDGTDSKKVIATNLNVTGLTAGKPLQVNSGGTAVESASDTGTGAVVRAISPTISSPTVSGHAAIEGVTATGATGTGKFVFDTSPTISSPKISGNFNLSVTTITSSTTAGDYATYIINAQSGNVTLTLPSAATYISRRYTIMRIDTYQHSSAYKAIVAAASGQTINGVGLINLANNDSITVQSNGANWVIVGGGMA